jgi:hypothetical protein
MISLVVHEDIEVFQKSPPEWKIRIDREAVAVRHDQPRAVKVSVPAHAHDRAVRHREVENGNRGREVKMHGWVDCDGYSAA